MAKKNVGSVAPKERIDISYKPATGNAKEGVELPFKLLVLGDFLGRADDRVVEEREPVGVNKNNFDEVMADAKLNASFSVKNRFSEKDEEININIDIKKLKDLEPDSLVTAIPELKKVHELRESLMALKGPLGNSPQMRRAIMNMLADGKVRDQLKKEIGSKS